MAAALGAGCVMTPKAGLRVRYSSSGAPIAELNLGFGVGGQPGYETSVGMDAELVAGRALGTAWCLGGSAALQVHRSDRDADRGVRFGPRVDFHRLFDGGSREDVRVTVGAVAAPYWIASEHETLISGDSNTRDLTQHRAVLEVGLGAQFGTVIPTGFAASLGTSYEPLLGIGLSQASK